MQFPQNVSILQCGIEGVGIIRLGHDVLSKLENTLGVRAFGAVYGPFNDQQIDWINSIGLHIRAGFAVRFTFGFSADHENSLIGYDVALQKIIERRNFHSHQDSWFLPAAPADREIFFTSWNKPQPPPTNSNWRSGFWNRQLLSPRSLSLSWHDLTGHPPEVDNAFIVVESHFEGVLPEEELIPPYEFYMQGRLTLTVPPTRYNRWCEKKGRIVQHDQKLQKDRDWLKSQGLSDREEAIWTTRFITKTDGIELSAATFRQ